MILLPGSQKSILSQLRHSPAGRCVEEVMKEVDGCKPCGTIKERNVWHLAPRAGQDRVLVWAAKHRAIWSRCLSRAGSGQITRTSRTGCAGVTKVFRTLSCWTGTTLCKFCPGGVRILFQTCLTLLNSNGDGCY